MFPHQGDNFGRVQGRVAEIILPFNHALPKEELENVQIRFFVENKVLMMKWRSPHIPASEEWAVVSCNTAEINFFQEK